MDRSIAVLLPLLLAPFPAGAENGGTADGGLRTRIEQASCAPDEGALAAALAEPAALTIGSGGVAADAGPWSTMRTLGCAKYVTSDDGRVRVWMARLSDVSEPYGEVKRGFAVLQWRTAEGVETWEDGLPDFSLDAIVDAIVPLPGRENEWLVTGLKWKGRWWRWAQVLKIDGEPSRVPGMFQVGRWKRDVLLLEAPAPETGKMRHSAVWNRWLRFDAASGELALEDVPGSTKRGPRRVVARRGRNGRFVVEGAMWDDVTVVRREVDDCP